MTKEIIISWTCILILASLISVGEVGAVGVMQDEVIEPQQEQAEQAIQVEYLDRVPGWNCFDYSVEYNRLHPEWGLVVISGNSRFQGLNHLVNFKVNEDKSLTIHDELLQTEYINKGWHLDPYVFYHFYTNGEQLTRNYKYLIPNAEEFYETL